jgi:hypothetical protein
MGDINQLQKICPTLVDAQENLLRTKPKDWNEIKNNKFMIINKPITMECYPRVKDNALHSYQER